MDRLHGDLRRRPSRLSDAGRGRRPRPPDLQSRRGPGRRLDARRTEVVYRSMFENVVGRDPNLYTVGVKGGAPEPSAARARRPRQLLPDGTSSSTAAAATRNTTGSATRAASTRTSGCTTPRPRPTRRSRTTSARTATRCGSATRCTSSPTGRTASPTSTPRRSERRTPTPVTTYADFDVMMPKTDGTADRLHPGRLPPRLRRSVRPRTEDRRHRALRPLGPARTGSSIPANISTRPTVERRQNRRPRGPRRRLPRPDGRGARPRTCPGRRGPARLYPALSPGRQDRGLLQRQERRLPALHPAGRGRRVDPDHDRPRPGGLPAGLVAGRHRRSSSATRTSRSSVSTWRRRSWSRSTPRTR